jgi:hypothetical protein
MQTRKNGTPRCSIPVNADEGSPGGRVTLTMNNRVEIDLDKLSNIAHTGVRRAVLFMGLLTKLDDRF